MHCARRRINPEYTRQGTSHHIKVLAHGAGDKPLHYNVGCSAGACPLPLPQVASVGAGVIG